MQIDTLIYEITRKCNMCCEHCLRGHAQNKNITKEIINKSLVGVSSINNVTFTGGEPSLNPAAIKYFYEAAKARRICIDSFYVVTNGKMYSNAMVHAFIDLYAYCGSNEMSGFSISQDQYHDAPERYKNIAKYKALSFCDAESRKKIVTEGIIDEGMAHLNGLGFRQVEPDIWHIEDGDVREGVVYINVNGDVIPGCDFSYASQKGWKQGNVLEKPLWDIIQESEYAQDDTQKVAAA